MKPSSYLKEISCLYVEDENSIREPLSMLLTKYLKEVFVAENGEEGLKLFKENRVDIVISDIRMPKMDGLEMSQKIKEIDSEVLIILVTAFSDIDYLKKAIEIGVEAYLTKPLELDKLFKKLNFLAEIIKNKRESKELLNLLKMVFDMQNEAILLLKEGEIVLGNNPLKSIFPDESEIFKLDIDFEKEKQKLMYKNKTIEIHIKKLGKYTLLSFLDITSYEDEILKDELTQLYNRKILNSLEFNGTKCLIILDIDNFKSINDTYGHLIGDEVLKTLAKTLQNSLRKKDVLIRWGGEEFLILLDGIDNKETVKMVAESIRTKVEHTVIEKLGKNVTCSFGVCCKDIHNENDFNEAVKLADDALYKAKENGKNRVEVC